MVSAFTQCEGEPQEPVHSSGGGWGAAVSAATAAVTATATYVGVTVRAESGALVAMGANAYAVSVHCRPLQEGDIVNVDVTAFLNGYHGDTNATFFVGELTLLSRLQTAIA